MNIAILDDDCEFSKLLARSIADYAALRDHPCPTDSYKSVSSLLSVDLSDRHVVFLDIEMPEANGIDVAAALRRRYPDVLIVFVTAFLQYAPKGYQVRAFRYLLKGDGMRRALEVCLDDCYQEVYATNELYELVDASHARIQVRLRDVIYIEGMRKRHVRTHMVGKPQPVECLGTLASHEKALAEHGFLRIQNSFLVNMEHIRDMRNYSVILDDGETLRASRSRFMQVAAHYALWRGRQL